MKDFLKIVKLAGGSRILLHYPLSNGMDLFEAGVEYHIDQRKDFNRLMERGDFVCLNPDEPVAAPLEDEAFVEAVSTFVGSVKEKNKKEKKEEVID